MRGAIPVLLALALAALGCSTITRVEGTDLVYRRVTPEVAFYMLLDSPDTMVLDLRAGERAGDELRSLGRSLELPLAELPARTEELAPYRDRTFLVYCGGDPDCAEEGMRLLVVSGCAYAVLVDGRFEDGEPPLVAAAVGQPAAGSMGRLVTDSAGQVVTDSAGLVVTDPEGAAEGRSGEPPAEPGEAPSAGAGEPAPEPDPRPGSGSVCWLPMRP